MIGLPDYLPDADVSVAVLEIDGPPNVDISVHQQPDKTVILRAGEAAIHGTSPRNESESDKDAIGFWRNPNDYVPWELHKLSRTNKL